MSCVSYDLEEKDCCAKANLPEMVKRIFIRVVGEGENQLIVSSMEESGVCPFFTSEVFNGNKGFFVDSPGGDVVFTLKETKGWSLEYRWLT
jgi:hypothetical protein